MWVGRYALLSSSIAPSPRKERDERLGRIAIAIVGVGTYAGTLTLAFGGVLISRVPVDYGSLVGMMWGTLVVSSIVAAVAPLGLGDAGLRRAIRRLAGGHEGVAQHRVSAGLAPAGLAHGRTAAAVYASA